MSSAENEVRKTVQSYIDACNASDPAAYKATLVEDVVFAPPGQAPLQGPDAVGAWVKEGFFDPFVVNFDATLDRIVVVGSEAFTPGTFTLEMKPKTGGDTMNVTGEFFNVFREQSDGSWKYAYAIFNFDQPVG